MPKERRQPAEYWMHDDLIGESAIHGEIFSVRARQHIASERYHE